MKAWFIICILIPVISSCNEKERHVQEEGEKQQCEVHHQPLQKASGYLPGQSIMVSPAYGYLEFHAQFGNRYPHFKHPYLSSRKSDGLDVKTTIDFCETCEKNYSQDFAAYLKISEKDRIAQYDKFLENNPKQSFPKSTRKVNEPTIQRLLPLE